MLTNRYSPLLLSLLLLSACANKPQPQPQTNNTNPAGAVATPSASNTPRVDRPQLVGLIKNVSIYPVPGQSANVAVSLVVQVSNSGVATNASDWRLEVTSNKRSFSAGLEPVHVNGV